jgi:chromosome segregation ATPase
MVFFVHGGTNMASDTLEKFTSPLRKLTAFFHNSRDNWKSKYLATKMQCKLLQNQTRAVEKSREGWRTRAAAAEEQVAELQHEIEQLRNQLKTA